jgi:molybdopterin converting factor small subunit
LRRLAGEEELDLILSDGFTVRDAISSLVNKVRSKRFEEALIDAELQDPRPNAAILVSGTEICALEGLRTPLKDGDEIVLIPVTHGG